MASASASGRVPGEADEAIARMARAMHVQVPEPLLTAAAPPPPCSLAAGLGLGGGLEAVNTCPTRRVWPPYRRVRVDRTNLNCKLFAGVTTGSLPA